MNVSLTPELDEFVGAKVASGRYTSASEVVREALRLLEKRDLDRSAQLAAFNRELERSLQSLEQGEFVEMHEVRAYIEKKSQERRRQQA